VYISCLAEPYKLVGYIRSIAIKDKERLYATPARARVLNKVLYLINRELII
jgi:hypothetical protein